MMNIKKKLTSRKFWLTVAATLSAIGTAVSGIYTDNYSLVICGVICTAISTCIYTIAESVIDSNAISQNTESEG